ncbi:GAF domain-containing protein [Corynebacterium lizhenjunii]|uniref:GAF domain-containing protein n=1 Tax=Corynebacterium lizhenjunii TaxID=2709394 RepID=A0A7T0KFX9_9CORY|nr:GAF domain-containing protein [Corynebacterium lizhenjunii]QPK79646.1 GAF domain-containing protein [Corynebacterium lizhenjunii]
MASPISSILSHLTNGTRVPDELAARLDAADAAALRALEHTIASHRTWRVMSTKLLDVSQMLNAGRDSGEVCDAIVRHARAIIGTDVGYISLNDADSGFTNVLTTTGVQTKEFREIRMPIGSGVLGIVAATNRPAWTYDHAQDPDVTHVDYVDAAVRAEGIRAILGAPIRIGGTTIGALLVGDRHPRHYSREEIAALELLGAMAGVALETAQVIETQGESVAQLTRSQVALSRHIQDLEWLNRVDAQLLQVLTGSAGFEQLAAVLTEVLEAEVVLWLADAPSPSPWAQLIATACRTRTFTTAAHDDVRDSGDGDSHPARADGEDSGRDGSSATGGAARCVLPVEFNSRLLGCICVGREVTQMQARILTHASSAFSAIALFHEALVDATARKVDDLVYSVVLGNAGKEEATRLRQLTGIDITRPQGLYFLAIAGDALAKNTAKAPAKTPAKAPVNVPAPAVGLSPRTVEDKLRGATAITRHDQHLCVLFAPDGDLDSAVAPLLQASAGTAVAAVEVGASRTIPQAHDAALAYLDSALALGLRGQLVTEATLGSVGLILGADPHALEMLRTHTIGRLLDYDATHHTALAQTAYHYLLHGHSVAETAKAVFVHVNTVRQRLERIDNLLGSDWATGPRSLDIYLALRLAMLERSTRA